MWCEAEIRKALHFVPGYIGFSPEYPQQMGKSFGHQTHHLMREHPLFDGRSSKTNKNPCIRIEMMPSNLERGDSEYQKCSTCTYDRYVRPAGLPSEEMWRVLDLEGQRERKTNEQKNDYKAHESPKTCGLKHCYKKKDSEYEKCSTCTYERSAVRDYDRDLRPAGLPSEEMWRVLDLEGQREPKTKEKETRFETEDRPQTYYSRHKAHFPAHYLHYEGYWDEHDYSHSDYDHHESEFTISMVTTSVPTVPVIMNIMPIDILAMIMDKIRKSRNEIILFQYLYA
ncbi:hypothetical protein HNY73_013245 [Argiope bruennichi]|uniref:Ciliary microtubule inner protein 2A-C-like domain-containing protein n=1 Tax=Argiope bruennichi TaxID=94029 RepID=A0A8T0EY81_ARGBR|nr:hypothetical protein HNY73_013245 [Argiope bruennichi]